MTNKEIHTVFIALQNFIIKQPRETVYYKKENGTYRVHRNCAWKNHCDRNCSWEPFCSIRVSLANELCCLNNPTIKRLLLYTGLIKERPCD